MISANRQPRAGRLFAPIYRTLGAGLGWHVPYSKTLYRKPLGFVLVEFFVDNVTLGARVDVGPGHL